MKALIASTALTIALSASASLAQSGVEIGMLTCKLTVIENDVVYSKEEFDCDFNPNAGNAESYTGQIKELGLNLTVTKDITIVWAVLAPTNVKHRTGSLKGSYVGGSAETALGAGIGVKALVGGGGNSFTLQP